MRALSSAQIGEVFSDLRDRLPQTGRQVRLAVKLRTDYDGPIARPSRKVPKPRPIIQGEQAAHMAAQRAVLRDVLRGLKFSKFGTGPKLQVKRACPPAQSPQPRPPVLLLTDQRSERKRRYTDAQNLGPVPNPVLDQRIAQINAQMACQFGPWRAEILALAYPVILL